MISGQLIYYLVPPMIYEIKENIKNKNNEDSTLENLKIQLKRLLSMQVQKLEKF